jgi:hypothetical protein
LCHLDEHFGADAGGGGGERLEIGERTIGGGDRADGDQIVVGGAVGQLGQVSFGHHNAATGLDCERQVRLLNSPLATSAHHQPVRQR